MANDRQIGGNAQVRGLMLWLAGAEPRGRVDKIELTPLQATLGPVTVGAEQVQLEQLRTPGDGQQATAAVADRVIAREVSIAGAGFELRAAALDAPQGLRVKRTGEVLADHLALDGFQVDIADVLGPREPQRERRPIRWDLLDVLTGHINVDLRVDLTGPLVGRRDETHHFRIDLDHGSVDYERLEGDVHWFERSFLGIEVVDDKLVLHRNLPLIPWSSKALLWWPLDGDGLELARRKRVMLRNLLAWEIPGEERERRAGGSRIRLDQIAAQAIDIRLGLGGPGWIDFGEGGRVRVGSAADDDPAVFSVAGALEYVASEPLRTTELAAGLTGAFAQLERLRLGGILLTGDRLHATNLRAALTWTGIRPGRLVVSADRLEGDDVRILPIR